jgi:hypothetical protein
MLLVQDALASWLFLLATPVCQAIARSAAAWQRAVFQPPGPDRPRNGPDDLPAAIVCGRRRLAGIISIDISSQLRPDAVAFRHHCIYIYILLLLLHHAGIASHVDRHWALGQYWAGQRRQMKTAMTFRRRCEKEHKSPSVLWYHKPDDETAKKSHGQSRGCESGSHAVVILWQLCV